jgi:hypothetical protein
VPSAPSRPVIRYVSRHVLTPAALNSGIICVRPVYDGDLTRNMAAVRTVLFWYGAATEQLFAAGCSAGFASAITLAAAATLTFGSSWSSRTGLALKSPSDFEDWVNVGRGPWYRTGPMC